MNFPKRVAPVSLTSNNLRFDHLRKEAVLDRRAEEQLINPIICSSRYTDSYAKLLKNLGVKIIIEPLALWSKRRNCEKFLSGNA